MQVFGIGKPSDPPPPERRIPVIQEHLSFWVLILSALGGFIVLMDPKLTIPIASGTLTMGGVDFSPDLRGGVVMSMMVAGFVSVIKFWFDTSKSSEAKSNSLARIAEASTVAPTTTTTTTGASSAEVVQPAVTVTETKP